MEAGEAGAGAGPNAGDGRYEDLFPNAPVAIFHSTPEGRFLRANPAMCRLLGYVSSEELVSTVTDMATQVYVDPGKRPEVMAAIARADGWIHETTELRRKDGAVVTVEMSGRKVLDASGAVQYLEGFLVDITEARAREARLRETGGRWHGLSDAATTVLVDGDLENGVLSFSAGWKRMIGYAEDEIASVQTIEDWEARIHPDDLAYARESIRAIVEERTPASPLEHRLRCKDGSWTWVLASGRVARRTADGRVVRLAGVLTDITRLKQIDYKLSETEALWNALGDTRVVLFYNDIERRVMRFSRGWPGMLGYGGGELPCTLTYEALLEMMTPEDGQRLMDEIREAVEGKAPALPTEYRLRCRDGSWKWVLVTGDFVRRAPSGAVLSTAGTVTDIGFQKEAEASLVRLSETLQQRVEEETGRRLAHERLMAHQARLASLGEMLGAIAHQWRQPLSTLGVAVQLIREFFDRGCLDRPRLEAQVDEAMRQIAYMSSTIDEFRDFYRPDKEKRLFDVRTEVRRSVQLGMSAMRSAGIGLVERIPAEGHFRAFGAPNEFKQVILNLLGNARDAIVERRARPESRPPSEGDLVEITLARAGGRIVVDVADNGVGITPADRVRLFEPLFTTKPEGKGTGLGLYMSRLLLEEGLGGSIVLHDRGDGGTVFRISVPEAPDQGSGLNTVILLPSEPTPQA